MDNGPYGFYHCNRVFALEDVPSHVNSCSAFFYRMERHAADGRPDLLPGVTLINAAPPESGVIVTSLRSDGDAAHGGMAVGDAVVSIDGTPIHSLDQASHYLIGTHRPMVTIGLVRGDHRLAIALDRSRT